MDAIYMLNTLITLGTITLAGYVALDMINKSEYIDICMKRVRKFIIIFWAGIMAVVIIFGLTTTAQAQQSSACDSKKKGHTVLKDKYGEYPFIEMNDNKGYKIIIYVNPLSKTWTVVKEDSEYFCALAAGKQFNFADPKDYLQFEGDPS